MSTASATAQITNHVSRDDYGRRNEHLRLDGETFAVIVTLPRTVTGPRYLVNDLRREGMEGVERRASLAAARDLAESLVAA